MTNKIEELTPEQTKQLDEYYEKWLKIGLCTDSADKPRAEKAIKRMYEILKVDAPEFVWVASPAAAEDYINEQTGKPKTNYNGTSFWGSQDSYWIAYYLFGRNLGVEYEKEDNEVLDLWAEVAQSATWFYPYEKAVVICDRPEEVHFNAAEQLHKEGGPAVKFRDNWGFWSLNGISVPQYIAETPATELDTQKVLGETNVDTRREGLRRIPLDRVIKDTNAKTLDSWKDANIGKWCDYVLYDMDFKDGKVRRVLQMMNPSVGVLHFERVEDNINTVKDALAFQDSEEVYEQPVVLT